MMKKLLILSSAVFALSFATFAQQGKQGVKPNGNAAGQTSGSVGLKTSSTATVVPDTLHYYLNKVFYKAGNTNINNFPYYKSAASTATGVSHCGSRFDVPPGDSITITGLEAYAQKHPFFAPTLVIKVHMFLCTLDVNGMPVLPPIDSVVTNVASGAVNTPSLIGGNFANPHKMKTSYAVLFRNMSTVSGDTVRLWRTDGAASTSTADIKFKYSDTENGKDYGFVRYSNGNTSTPPSFYSTKNFTLFPGFGQGTQYEFIVAPRVNYLLKAGQMVPTGVVVDTSTSVPPGVPDTMCTRGIMTFTNTSSKFYEHRMFNLNAFYLKWAQGSPFLAQPSGGFSADSALTWSFEFYDAAIPAKDSRVFLPYTNTGTIMAQTDLAYYPDCFTANEFRARLRPMGAFNKVPQYVYNESFTVCLKYCNGDTVGVDEKNILNNVTVFPNPSINGKTMITGLDGNNTIYIYNLLGQTVAATVTEKPTFEVDLSKYPNGTYVIRIVNSEKQSKTIKLLHQQ